MIPDEISELRFGPRTYDAFTGLSGISKFINRGFRTATPWGPHHYPLMSLWAAAGGECAAKGDQSFSCLARALFRLAFPQMPKPTANRLIALADSSLPEAMHELGITNKDIPWDSPEMDEFRARFSAAQEKQPDFIRNALLYAMIICKFEGRDVAGSYLWARLSGKAS